MIQSSTSFAGTRLLLLSVPLGLVLIDPVMAHPASGSQETSHLIADIIGYLILGFVLYVGYLATRQVIYPRLHRFLK